MNSNLVSIIVPIYNVEKYILRCVESLKKQTYSNIEIILVDDGSPDNSGRIIDQIAHSDTRVKVIHQNNSGVSAARNAGLQLAVGDYIMFVDADDWVEDTYVSYFLKLVKENDCLIAMNTKCYTGVNDTETDKEYTVSAEKAIEWIYSGRIFVGVWNKIYRRDFLTEYSIEFHSDIWYGEGMLFNVECLQYADTVVICEKNIYHQTFNPDSAMRSFSIESNICGIHSLDVQRTLWKKITPEIEDAWEYHRFCFNRTIIFGLVRTNTEKQYYKEYKTCVKELRKGLRIPLKYEKGIKPKVYWIRLALFPYPTAKKAADNYLKRLNAERRIT